MKSKWSAYVVTRKEKPITETEMNTRLAEVWGLLHSLGKSAPAPLLPKAKTEPRDVTSDNKRSAS